MVGVRRSAVIAAFALLFVGVQPVSSHVLSADDLFDDDAEENAFHTLAKIGSKKGDTSTDTNEKGADIAKSSEAQHNDTSVDTAAAAYAAATHAELEHDLAALRQMESA
eukprot:TRINITY_DN77460_c0_g1_i1.p1 TRINITY_DN77460_c0_g1~~TRINITY_DN77460_c0_g1_i1.p1  ORF type:complete len:109 (+),score=32.04 TRINITY_DN77460_c0_g1_i1:86-412(+)